MTRHVRDAWHRAGGQPISGKGWESREELNAWEHRVKKALSLLREDGRIREAYVDGERVHGVWEWVGEESPGSSRDDKPEVSVGSGSYLVYGVYDARQRDDARSRGEERWLIKVGKTRLGTPFARIQDGAFLADKLVWGIAIQTDDPDGDEKLLKSVLKRRGRAYNGTGGTEWFLTSPAEIEAIYVMILEGSA
jgi:hypothetical protein